MNKEYLKPWTEIVRILGFEKAFCAGTLSPLEESSDLEDLDWN